VQEHDKLIEPFECENDVCGRRSAFKLDERKTTQQDFQILRFQERQEDIGGGEKPQTAKAEITEGHCGTILPGNRVTIAAIVRERLRVKSTGKTNQFSIILDVVSITPDETESRITYTMDDTDRFNKYVLEIRDFDEWVIDWQYHVSVNHTAMCENSETIINRRNLGIYYFSEQAARTDVFIFEVFAG
jgi:DNA replicative helicase MCM subunit Mcm2 (Cdc46/Mcm family)